MRGAPDTPSAETCLSYTPLRELTQREVARYMASACRLKADDGGVPGVEIYEGEACGAIDLLFSAGLACGCQGEIVEKAAAMRTAPVALLFLADRVVHVSLSMTNVYAELIWKPKRERWPLVRHQMAAIPGSIGENSQD